MPRKKAWLKIQKSLESGCWKKSVNLLILLINGFKCNELIIVRKYIKKELALLAKMELYNISKEYSKIQEIGGLTGLAQTLEQLGCNLNKFDTQSEISVDKKKLMLFYIKYGI